MDKEILKAKYTVGQHQGGLEQFKKTEKKVSYEVFWDLATSGMYEYYGYDERIKAHRYLLKDMQKNIVNGRQYPEWLQSYTKERIV